MWRSARGRAYPAATWVPHFISKPSRLAVGAAAIVLGLQQRSAAQSDTSSAPLPDRFRIEYRAPPECPDAEIFKASVRSRVPAGWEAAPQEFARRVAVVVSGDNGGYLATVELFDERGERVTRAVHGHLCSSVVDGAALVTALAIQAREQEADLPSKPSEAPAAERSTSMPESSASGRAAAAAATGLVGTAPAAPALEGAANDELSVSGVRMSARALLSSGIGPNVALGAGLGVIFERRRVRLGVAVAGFRTPRTEARGVPVQFELLSARIEGCPYVLAIAAWIVFEPCPFAEFGSLTGEAFEKPPTVVRGDRGSSAWLSTGGIGRLAGRFGAFTLDFEALLGVPLKRERFYIEGGETVHQTPPVYGAIALGFGVHF
jgi:hypothetical protein